MKYIACIMLSSCWFVIVAAAQGNLQEQTKPIVDEGKALYRSEMASWYGTDIILEKIADSKLIGGYFSYTAEGTATSVFYSKEDTPKVIGTVEFDETYNLKNAKVSLAVRDFTKDEWPLYVIRKKAHDLVKSDTLFKKYENTDMNLIPIISNGEKKVYVLTGPKKSGVVIFGNDYLLLFNDDNELVTKKQLHRNILPQEYGQEKKGSQTVGGIHSHQPETGNFITATDICTLMLYEKMAHWKSYAVVSEKYMSLWNCETNTLITIAR